MQQRREALGEAPFARWMLPFVALAVVAQASAWVVPDVRSTKLFVASCVVLAIVSACALLPWRRLPFGARMLMPLGYLGSLLLLLASLNVADGGMRSLVLLPIIWVALYHRRWEGIVVTACAIGVLTAVALFDHEAADLVARRAALWGAMGALIVLSVTHLRGFLGAAIEERDEALRTERILAAAAAKLNAVRDSESVIAMATRLAAQVASPTGTEGRRASYLRVFANTALVTGTFDEHGQTASYMWPLADHPYLPEVIRSRSPVSGEMIEDELGPSLAALIHETGIRYGAWVPVSAEGRLHGVLALTSRSKPIGAQELARCEAVAHILELALANALAYEINRHEATTDPLTSLSNRRGLRELFRARRARRSYGVLALDVDGLKEVNDRFGHAAGDELIASVGEALRTSLRGGDVLGRIGGDEFAAVIFDADEWSLRHAAERILDSVRDASSEWLEPSVSIGGACADAEASFGNVLHSADAAMYEAKRAGGMRFELAEDRVSGALSSALADSAGSALS